jgi:NADH dehydrogenase/NADH:ubiquinone oxidoreductase subunit G
MTMLRLTIDDLPIQAPAGYTLLQAAREHHISIPTLCAHEALLPYGACRLCLVELVERRGSRLVAACMYPCQDGLVVRTQSELVIGTRRSVIELLMVTGAHLPVIRALAAEMGVDAPDIGLPPDDCILCGLCVRACRDLAGVSAISLTQRGMARAVSTPFEISSADCIECGTCALVCPTGAIHIEDVTRPIRTAHTWRSPYERRACRLCEYDPPGAPFPEDYRELLEIRDTKA